MIRMGNNIFFMDLLLIETPEGGVSRVGEPALI